MEGKGREWIVEYSANRKEGSLYDFCLVLHVNAGIPVAGIPNADKTAFLGSFFVI